MEKTITLRREIKIYNKNSSPFENDKMMLNLQAAMKLTCRYLYCSGVFNSLMNREESSLKEK